MFLYSYTLKYRDGFLSQRGKLRSDLNTMGQYWKWTRMMSRSGWSHCHNNVTLLIQKPRNLFNYLSSVCLSCLPGKSSIIRSSGGSLLSPVPSTSPASITPFVSAMVETSFTPYAGPNLLVINPLSTPALYSEKVQTSHKVLNYLKLKAERDGVIRSVYIR